MSLRLLRIRCQDSRYLDFKLYLKGDYPRIAKPGIFIFCCTRNGKDFSPVLIGTTENLSLVSGDLFDQIGNLINLATHVGFIEMKEADLRKQIFYDIWIGNFNQEPVEDPCVWLNIDYGNVLLPPT